MKTKAERDAIREHLERLRDANGGILTADVVVDDARRKSSPIHDEFEWDVKAAAHQHWLDVARRLIRSFDVVVTTTTTSIAIPYYVRDPALPADVQGYRATMELRGEKDAARDVLVDEFMRAASALRRAKAIAIAFEMDGEVDAVVRQVDVLRTKLSADVRAN